MTSQWDEFSKSLAEESLPRRESLRRLGFLFAGAVLSPLGVGTAWARGPDPCKSFCNRCKENWLRINCLAVCHACNSDTSRLAGYCGTLTCCGAGQTNCGTYCANLGNDWYNCGACGHGCYVAGGYESSACIDGQCEYWCVEGAVRCDGTCTRLEYDPYNCGACGNVCGGPDPHCNNGVCSECSPGVTNCGGACADLAWDNNNCGACGNACGQDMVCDNGACTECALGLTFCTDPGSGYAYCADLMSDDFNCGACGYRCNTYDYLWCYYGSCYYGPLYPDDYNPPVYDGY
jgi:hypothetical protein